MKTGIRIYILVITAMILVLSSSCKKKETVTDSVTSDGTVTDIDGNVYHTVSIGTQIWMVENLKTTKYNNGISIPYVPDDNAWNLLTTPGYCWFAGDPVSNKNRYGGLYNWFAVNTGRLAPTGWHVPAETDWALLTTYLGGETVAGGKMKYPGTVEEGTGYWHTPNAGATNESGFLAYPGGLRIIGVFDNNGYNGYWWSATEGGSSSGWTRKLFNNDAVISTAIGDKTEGLSVRCVKN